MLGDVAGHPSGELNLLVKDLLLGECHLCAVLLQGDEIVDEPLDELLVVRCFVCSKLGLCFCDLFRRFFMCLPFFFAEACFVFFSNDGLQFEILLLGYHEPFLSNLIILLLMTSSCFAYQLPNKREHLRVVPLGKLQHINLLSFIFLQA